MADRYYQIDVRSGTVVIPTSDTVTTGTNTEVLEGQAQWIEMSTPAMQATDSTKIELVTSVLGGTIFTSGTKAESTVSQIGSVFPLYGTMKVVATAEGTQAAAKSIGYTIYYLR